MILEPAPGPHATAGQLALAAIFGSDRRQSVGLCVHFKSCPGWVIPVSREFLSVVRSGFFQRECMNEFEKEFEIKL